MIPKLWVSAGVVTGFLLTYLLSFLYMMAFRIFPSSISFTILLASAIWIGDNIYRLQQNRPALSIAINAINGIKAFMPKEKPKSSFEVSGDRKTVSLSYYHGTKEHKIILPHNSRLRIKMSKHYVYLIKSDGSETNITQQPGIPYLATARDLGGIGYKVIDNATLETVEELGDDSIPLSSL